MTHTHANTHKETHKFRVEFEVSAQFLQDVLVQGIEGFIGDWCRVEKSHIPNMYAEVTELYDDGSVRETWKIGHRTLERGMKLLLNGDVTMNLDMVRELAVAVANQDAGFIDADLADCIIQAGLFQELRYP